MYDIRNDSIEASIYSDLHKDVYGYRPRGAAYIFSSEAAYKSYYDELVQELEIIMERETQNQAICYNEYISEINMIMQTVDGCTKQDAIRYIADSLDCSHQDFEYIDYCKGVPYGTTKKLMKLMEVL